MGRQRCSKCDFDTLLHRRMHAAGLFKRGIAQAEVARRLGVNRQLVSRWASTWQEKGRRGLRPVGRAGRPPQALAGAETASDEGTQGRGGGPGGERCDEQRTEQVRKDGVSEFRFAFHNPLLFDCVGAPGVFVTGYDRGP
jgi:transposase-like protein